MNVKVTPMIVLLAGLAVLTLGMVLVVLGVIHGSVFLPGVTILSIGTAICAAAGIFASVRGDREPA